MTTDGDLPLMITWEVAGINTFPPNGVRVRFVLLDVAFFLVHSWPKVDPYMNCWELRTPEEAQRYSITTMNRLEKEGYVLSDLPRVLAVGLDVHELMDSFTEAKQPATKELMETARLVARDGKWLDDPMAMKSTGSAVRASGTIGPILPPVSRGDGD